VRFCELAEPRRDGLVGALGVGERAEQVLERAVLAEIQDLVLPPEVVIQIAGGQVGRDGDLPHAGGGETARAKDPGRRLENLDAARVGPA
jgi:hypothetical protein